MRRRAKFTILIIIFSLLLFFFFFYFLSKDDEEYQSIKTISTKGTYYNDKCYVPTGRNSCAPQYIIIGAMKCGTTSMFSYLIKHPEILPLKQFALDPKNSIYVLAEKEVRFFNDPNWKNMANQYDEEKAISLYLDLFEEIPPPSDDIHPNPQVEKNRNHITGEATPLYICQAGVAQRIHKALPFVKIIVMLRNPVDRAYSEYWFRKNLKTKVSEISTNINLTHQMIFKKCIETDLEMLKYCDLDEFVNNPSLTSALALYNCYRDFSKRIGDLSRATNSNECQEGPFAHLCLSSEISKNCVSHGASNSVYFAQIFEYFEIFPVENVKVVKSEVFYEETGKVMEDIGNFLGVSEFNWDDVTEKAYNIINPNSMAAGNLQIVTEGTKGLQIGAGETSDYPPLDTKDREELIALFRPYNIALSKLLNDTSYIDW